MLRIIIPPRELFVEATSEIITVEGRELALEHSLVSLAKWESKWNKPFLSSKDQKTFEEVIDYIRCMTITQNVDPMIYYGLSNDNLRTIHEYIEKPMTATTIRRPANAPRNRDIITAEIIYYWMICYQIPFECQKWHLNRLLTLIEVCNEKNKPQKKKKPHELAAHYRELNEARRKKFGTKG